MAVLMELTAIRYQREPGERESQLTIVDEDGLVAALGTIERIAIYPTDGGTFKITITISKDESYQLARSVYGHARKAASVKKG